MKFIMHMRITLIAQATKASLTRQTTERFVSYSFFRLRSMGFQTSHASGPAVKFPRRARH